jgi:hypothetical protein
MNIQCEALLFFAFAHLKAKQTEDPRGWRANRRPPPLVNDPSGVAGEKARERRSTGNSKASRKCRLLQ